MAAPIQFKAVGLLAIDAPAPKKSTDEENAGVGGEQPPVAILRLERLDDRVREERRETDEREKRWRVGPEPAPDRVCAAKLADRATTKSPNVLRTVTALASPFVRTSPAQRPRIDQDFLI